MIPPAIMYVLGGVLGLWGAYRIYLGRRAVKARGSHLAFGVLYILMSAFLILTTAGVIRPPRFGASPRRPSEVPVYANPRPAASAPSTGGATQPSSRVPASGPERAAAASQRVLRLTTPAPSPPAR